MAGGQLDWRDVPFDRLFPWVKLFRCVRNSVASSQLLLAAMGLVLHSAGMMFIASLFGTARNFQELVETLTGSSVSGERLFVTAPEIASYLQMLPARLAEPVISLALPFVRFFAPDRSWAGFFEVFLASVWTVLVWTLVGGAICRIALARMTRSEPVGPSEALQFAARKALTLIASPVCPLVGVGFLTIPAVVISLLYRIPGVGPVVAGILLFVPLLAGLVMTVILVGLALGWPLMPPAVAADEGDGFDALSRSYAYVGQRRAYYLFLILLAWLIGMAGLFFVDVFAWMVLQLTHWTLGLTAPRELLDQLFGASSEATLGIPGHIHRFWIGLIAVLVHAWIYSYFWTAFSTIYLVVRQSVDGTPFHDLVWLIPKRGPSRGVDAMPTAPPAASNSAVASSIATTEATAPE